MKLVVRAPLAGFGTWHMASPWLRGKLARPGFHTGKSRSDLWESPGKWSEAESLKLGVLLRVPMKQLLKGETSAFFRKVSGFELLQKSKEQQECSPFGLQEASWMLNNQEVFIALGKQQQSSEKKR